MASHVIATGRRRIALVGGPEASSASAGRMHGYRKALRKAGLAAVNEPDVWGELSRTSGALRARSGLAEHPDTDAFVCGNDVIALGVLDVFSEINKRVAEDIAISGFDHMSFSSAGPLQLSTVTVPRDALGRHAVQRLFCRIEGDTDAPRNDVLPYTMQIRRTTVPAR